MLLQTILSLSLIFCYSISDAANVVVSLCGANGWTVYKGNCYKLFVHETTYDQAKTLCQAYSSNLVSIHSLEENNFVAQLTTADFDICADYCDSKGTDLPSMKHDNFELQPIQRSFWIGLHRVCENDYSDVYTCHWDDGTQCDYGVVPKNALFKDWGHPEVSNFPWSTGQPSGDGWGKGIPEICSHFWWKTGWWNDITCDAKLSGAICKKPVKC